MNRERNHPDVVFRVNECIRKRTRSRETRTTSASGESNAVCVVGSILGGGEEVAVSSGGAAGRSSVTDAMRDCPRVVVNDRMIAHELSEL